MGVGVGDGVGASEGAPVGAGVGVLVGILEGALVSPILVGAGVGAEETGAAEMAWAGGTVESLEDFAKALHSEQPEMPQKSRRCFPSGSPETRFSEMPLPRRSQKYSTASSGVCLQTDGISRTFVCNRSMGEELHASVSFLNA